jgi:hypothetical protein
VKDHESEFINAEEANENDVILKSMEIEENLDKVQLNIH